MAEPGELRGGALLTEISNAMVHLHREHFGRGPSSAKTFVFDDMLMCVLHDVYTTVEKTLIRVGKTEHVRQTRLLHQQAAADDYKGALARLVDREIVGFSSTVHFDPDLAIEIFILGGPKSAGR